MRKLLNELLVALLLMVIAWVAPAIILCNVGPEYIQEEMREVIHEAITFILNIFK